MERTMTPITYVNSRRDRMRRILAEGGQTPTEYLMIVGIMAAVILIAFIFFFWDTVKPAASSWSQKASDAVGASKDKKSTVDQ
jgi:hypothetical protein